MELVAAQSLKVAVQSEAMDAYNPYKLRRL